MYLTHYFRIYFHQIFIYFIILFQQINFTYHIEMIIRFLTAVHEGRDLPEFLPELVLPHVEIGGFLANIRHFIRLQGSHLLLDGDADLLGVVPLLGQFLCTFKK